MSKVLSRTVLQTVDKVGFRRSRTSPGPSPGESAEYGMTFHRLISLFSTVTWRAMSHMLADIVREQKSMSSPVRNHVV